MRPKVENAIALGREGLLIHPVLPNAKIPRLPNFGKEARTALTDRGRRRIEWWWKQKDYNIGVTVYGTRFVVIDIDVKNGKKGFESLAALEARLGPLPQSFRVNTPSGGQHIYLRLPSGIYIGNGTGWIPEECREGIDIRGNSGQSNIIGPGSVIDGKEYTAVGSPKDIADCPEKWLGLIKSAASFELKTRKKKLDPVCELDTPINLRAADQIVKDSEEAGQGDRNNSAFQLASRLKDQGLSLPEVLDRMIGWNGSKCAPPLDDDELERTTTSAYYSGNAPGVYALVDPLDEFTAVDIPDGKPRQKRHALTPKELMAALRPIPYLIQDLLPKDATVCFFGDTSIRKSLIMIDIGGHVACGLPYRGRETEQGLVVLVAAEGGMGAALRFHAWLKRQEVETPLKDIPFAIIPYQFNILDKKEREELSRIIKDAESRYGCKCKLIIFDTLAKTMTGDEWRDMGLYVEAMDYFRLRFEGPTVATVHHTGKDKSRGARGGYQLKCDVDAEIEIQPGKIINPKMRDGQKQPIMYFDIENTYLGEYEGKPINAPCLVEKTDIDLAIAPSPAEAGLNDRRKKWVADIRDVMTEHKLGYVTAELMYQKWSTHKEPTVRSRLFELHSAGVLTKPDGIPTGYAFLHGGGDDFAVGENAVGQQPVGGAANTNSLLALLADEKYENEKDTLPQWLM